MEPFDSPPLASHCSTRTQKMVMPPGSMILGNSEVRWGLTGFFHRYIDLANATSDELQQLAQTCESASLGVVQEGVTNELYYKVRKMDFECFAPSLVLDRNNLVELIGNYLFEGFQSKNKIRTELHELNVYSTHLIVMRYSTLAEIKTKRTKPPPSRGFFH